MTNAVDRVAVCSRSFSQHPVLRAELLEHYALVSFNDQGRRLDGSTLVDFLRGHQKAIVALESIDATVLQQLPDLRVVSKYGVGLDSLDLAALRAHGVRLGWTGGVNRRSVSELAIALAIALLREIPQANREVLSGTWRQRPGGLLSSRTVGIIGCGHVGKDLAVLLRGFGCLLLAHDIRDYAEFYAANGIEPVSLDELLATADVVTLHVPLDATTRGMLSRERLALLKPDAVLINTARGGLVDEAALKHALREGRIAGAAFDVFDSEPPQDPELLSLPSFIATPHIGGSAREAVLAMGRAAITGLDRNELPDGRVG